MAERNRRVAMPPPEFRYIPFDRQKIKVAAILNRLTDCATGKCEMTPSAVTAAAIVLKKVLPDLSSVELSGQVEEKVKIYAEVPRPIESLDEWLAGNPNGKVVEHVNPNHRNEIAQAEERYAKRDAKRQRLEKAILTISDSGEPRKRL